MDPVVWTVEGQAVYGEHHAPAKATKKTPAIVLIHGLNSCLKEFGDLPARLADAGFHAIAFDLRGFGASGGERGRVGIGRAIVDVEAAIDHIRAHITKGPIGAVGHSLGAAYVLGIQARRGAFDAITIAHPVDRIADELPSIQRAGGHVAGRVQRRRLAKGRPPQYVPYPVSYRKLFEDPAAARAAKADPFLLPKANLANWDFFSTMRASNWAARVHCPVQAITSEQDRLVAPKHQHDVIAALPTPPADVVAHRGGHSCWRDLDQDRLASSVAHFMGTHLGGQ